MRRRYLTLDQPAPSTPSGLSETIVEPSPPGGLLNTRTPALNLASRANIISDGPGTAQPDPRSEPAVFRRRRLTPDARLVRACSAVLAEPVVRGFDGYQVVVPAGYIERVRTIARLALEEVS